MTTALVDRATSSMLIGPDWAMNTEICEMLNRDFGQAKDVVKGLKRRLKHKNPKVQLLALTIFPPYVPHYLEMHEQKLQSILQFIIRNMPILHSSPNIDQLLETVMKNCGDIVHMHVAEKGVLQAMVKIVRKKPDFQVKEKILVLIDTWQEGFGGPRSRYPEYYAAYQELMHAGAVFPQRPDRSAPILASSQAQSRFSPAFQQDAPESSDASDFPILSQAEIQNARGMMDVLSEMLNALDPANKEGLKEEVIVDLVEQCRSYKRRVYHLVNTTSDEELLSLGLALNDDLQRVLAKHDAAAAGIAIRQEKPKPLPALVDVGAVTSSEPNGSSSVTTTAVDPFDQLLLTNSPHADEKDGSTKPQAKMDTVDLLSWDDVPPSAENHLSLVPINEPPTSSTSDQNVLALTVVDGFSNDNTGATSSIDSHSSFPAPQFYSSDNGFQMPPSTALTSHGGLPNSGAPHEQTIFLQESQINQGSHVLNGHAPQGFGLQQQQPLASTTNEQNEAAFPLPPWETQSTQDQPTVSQPQLMQTTQTTGGYPQMPGSQLPNLQVLPPQSSQVMGMYQYPSQLPQAMQGGQMTGMQLQSAMHGGQATGMQLQPEMNGQMVGMQQQQAVLSGLMVGMQLQPAMLGQMGGYTYAQQQGIQYYDQMRPGYQYASPTDLSQRMYGLSMHGNGGQMNVNPSSYQMPTSSSVPLQNHQPMKPKRPEDNLFGDLVSIAKVKQNK